MRDYPEQTVVHVPHGSAAAYAEHVTALLLRRFGDAAVGLATGGRPGPRWPCAPGRISGKVEAVVNYPKTTGYTTGVCAAPQFSVRHEFEVNGFAGSVAGQGAALNVGGTSDSTGTIILTSRNQNWSLTFRANYPSSVTHNDTVAVTCNGQTAISGGSETIPLTG